MPVELICPKCGYDGHGIINERKGYQQHQEQLNPDNSNNWICGNCSEAFI